MCLKPVESCWNVRCLAVINCYSNSQVPSQNMIGDVPFEWNKNEEHIGHDIKGKKIKKKERRDKVDAFLARADN